MFVQDAAGSESTHSNDRVAAWDVRHTDRGEWMC